MDIPYFSSINMPGSLIVGCLLLVFVGCLSYMSYIFVFENLPTKLKSILIVIIPMFLTICFIWVLIGDSISWSEPIGLWLRGR